MQVADLIQFRSDLFFEGAVQLLWVDENAPRADAAGRSFVFHGPRYHGVSADGRRDEAYRLTDTATLAADLLSRMTDGHAGQANPFSLAIAGYGSGKSHFGLALTQLLRGPKTPTSEAILLNLAQADAEAAARARRALETMSKPALVVALDGTGNFNLGSALSASLFRALREHELDDRPLRELSPRFDDAVRFVSRSYERLSDEFATRFNGRSVDAVVAALEERDEHTYALVDEVYVYANGAHIPVVGRESAQDLITTFCDIFCGDDGPFSRLMIVFDEFGRFLEYVAERPALAGDSALQQIFQGVQDNAARAHFVGFIQYELKAYLARMGNRDAMHIQKYITRFDVAKKYYVSSNLETIIAHLLEKKDEAALEGALRECQPATRVLHARMAAMLPGLRQLPVWSDPAEFERVVVQGCWPLHPLATWFLTRQQDIVQSRSAITFVKNALDAAAPRELFDHGRLTSIAGSRIVAGEMLTEMLAAERAHGGGAIDNLIATLAKYEAQLAEPERALLIAVAATKKMRVTSSERGSYDALLAEFAGYPIELCQAHIDRLELELGILAWSAELQQYEIITDAATRGQYHKDLRAKLGGVSPAHINEIFINRAKAWSDTLLDDIATTFDQEHEILTLEWRFNAHLTSEPQLDAAIHTAFADWRQAVRPDEAKGQVLFCFVDADEDIEALNARADAVIRAELDAAETAAAPVWVILLVDRSRRIRQYLATLYVLDDGFDEQEKERYARFIPDERETAKQGLYNVVREAIKDRVSVYAGVKVPSGRLGVEASAIFKQVYPHALPFPFDGLSGKASNGSGDVAALARALFSGAVSTSWISMQPVKLQNRVHTVLGRTWGVLDGHDGKIKQIPDDVRIRDMLDLLEEAHRTSPQRSLRADLDMLTRPPFGCNVACASLLLGLFVGRTLPPRALQYEAHGVSLSEWLPRAYPANSRFLSDSVLGQTTVLFLTQDAVGRWKMLLAEWDAEQTYLDKVDRLRQANQLRISDPLPEALEPLYKSLCSIAQHEEQELAAHEGKLREIENRLEVALSRGNIGECIAVAEKYLTRRKEMKEQTNKWTTQQHGEVDGRCEELATLIREHGQKWIASQACNSAQQVTDFRNRMTRAKKTLEGLRLPELARLAEQQMQSMIARVEERHQYETALHQAADLVRTPQPLSSTPIREVNDRIDYAERLIALLSEALKTLSMAEDVRELIAQLRDKQTELRDFRTARRDVYSRLFDLTPTTLEEASDVKYRLGMSSQQFLETKAHAEIQQRLASCSALTKLYAQLDTIEAAEDQLVHSLQAAYASSAYMLPEDHGVDEEGEPELDLEWMHACVTEYVRQREAVSVERSAVWLNATLDELAIYQRDEERLLAGVPVTASGIPAFLSQRDRLRVLDEIETANVESARARERVRARKMETWANRLREQVSTATLSKHQCNEFLTALQSPPSYVEPVDLEGMGELRQRVERRLDEFDISDLVARIEAMPSEKRRALLDRLHTLYQEA